MSHMKNISKGYGFEKAFSLIPSSTRCFYPHVNYIMDLLEETRLLGCKLEASLTCRFRVSLITKKMVKQNL